MSATTWLVIPLADEAAFRAAYDSIVAAESLGIVQPDAAGTHGFVGSQRITPAERDAVLAAVPSAAAYDAWPPPGGWDYPGS